MVTGLICGPHGLRIVDYVHEVERLAEIGIIVLLFSVGMEFSIRRILEYKRFFWVGGAVQIGLTSLIGFCVAQLVGRPIGESIFLGFLLSLSSTAIVLRILLDRWESHSPHGKIMLGILIFQDIIVVPMMLLTPILAGNTVSLDSRLFIPIGEGVAIISLVFYGALFVVPRLLYFVAKTRSRELFLLTVFVICFSVAWSVQMAGLTLSLGAFLAGLVLSESDYKNQAIGDIIPFQDIFTSVFFVTIGMLVDIQFLFQYPITILTLSTLIIFLKFAVITGVGFLLGMPLRTSLLAGLSLAQVGEFSFVLLKSGMDVGIGTDYYYQLFLAVAVVTMAVTPFLIGYGPKIANFILLLPWSHKVKAGFHPIVSKPQKALQDHVIIVGYGLSGKNLARSCKSARVPYIILDVDPEKIRLAKRFREPIHFGDATHDRILKHAEIEKAKIIAVVVNDPTATFHIVEHARNINPNIYIIVRTHYVDEMGPLFEMGADDVISDEFGTSVEIFTRVLMKYKVKTEEIDNLVNVLRKEGYEIPRLHYKRADIFSDFEEYLANVEVESFYISMDSMLAGKTVAESELGKKYGLNVILIRRQGVAMFHISADTLIEPGDSLVVMGAAHNLARAKNDLITIKTLKESEDEKGTDFTTPQ